MMVKSLCRTCATPVKDRHRMPVIFRFASSSLWAGKTTRQLYQRSVAGGMVGMVGGVPGWRRGSSAAGLRDD